MILNADVDVHDGAFTCVATNLVGEDSLDATVTVFGTVMKIDDFVIRWLIFEICRSASVDFRSRICDAKGCD